MFQGLSPLLMSGELLIAAYWTYIPLSICVTLLLDYVSRDRIDYRKVVVNIALDTLLLYVPFEVGVSNIVVPITFSNGELGLNISGKFAFIVIVLIVFNMTLWALYFFKIYRQSPRKLKNYAFFNLSGAIIMGLVAGALSISSLAVAFPGINRLFVAIGAIIMTISFRKEEKLAFVLPFKTLRLIVLDTRSGIPIFTHSWIKTDKSIDDVIFSGVLQGVTSIINESLNRGDVQEINLEKAVLLIHRSKQYPIACILVATKVVGSLRNALDSFATQFYRDFNSLMKAANETSNFDGAEDLIEKFFPFVPEYENL